MDPYGVLGVPPGAAAAEVAAAYRELAKRWHPDRGGGSEAQQRMAEINVAYDVLRAAAQNARAARARPHRPAGAWLGDPIRRALGAELLEALGEGEQVRLVTPAATWASPRAILAVTERRLLWLLDDAPTARVRSLAFRDVATVEHRERRKRATVTVHTLSGRRHVFAELRPHTAAAIARHVHGR